MGHDTPGEALHRRRLLIVEDDVPLASLMAANLERAGYEPHVETTGRGALYFVTVSPPDLVLLDLRLPDINGYEVCKALRKLYHPWVVPVVMVTGLDQPIDQLRGFAYGADAYLTKPFQLTELLETVTLLVTGHSSDL